MTKKDLKPFGAVIQRCPECGKIDVYKDDGHDCEMYIANREQREMTEENN
jgi:hypothetical protein